MSEAMSISRRDKYNKYGYEPIKSKKTININFDLDTLNLMGCYVLSRNSTIKTSHLFNMRNLMLLLDMDVYANSPEKLQRIEFIKRGLDGRMNHNINSPELLIKFINGGILEENLVEGESFSHELSTKEILWVNDTISDSLNHAFIYNNVDRLLDELTKFKSATYTSKAEITERIKEEINLFQQQFRRNEAEDPTDLKFSLVEGEYENTVRDVHESLTNPSGRLYSGMTGLNELIGGAYENGRSYMFLGPSAAFKSGTLLTMAYQIKKHNKFYQTKDPTKRPAVVLLTMENSVKETIERLFNMSTVGDDIRDFSADEVIDMLKTDGELYLSDESPIDIIIRYKPNNSVDAGYLYTLVEELEDEGIETICFIQDYVRRIKPIEKQMDIRLQMGEVVNDFKVFCTIKDIPLITAGQLNRDAAKTIETAKQAKKSDIIRMLGRSNVGESMLMIDNIDVAVLINIEFDGEGNRYLGFNRIKIRNKPPSERHILFYPFHENNSMKLMEDMDLDLPVYKETLSGGINSQLFNSGKPQQVPSNSGMYGGGQRKSIQEIMAEKKYKDTADNIFNNIEEISSTAIVTEPLFTIEDPVKEEPLIYPMMIEAV